MKPRALDLFCCAGGATRGLQLAGFHVTGVDIRPQPRYCGDAFVQADALRPPFRLSDFDFVWASPPCQEYTSLRVLQGDKRYPDLIDAVRAMLNAAGVLYVIENVPGAPLRNPIVLCGSRFGLKVRRHRLFESQFLGMPGNYIYSGCHHTSQGQPIDVSGTGSRRVIARKDGAGGDSFKPRNLAEAQAAIGIDWMTRPEIAQAIPPAYGEFIGRAALNALNIHQRGGA
jgi:DNA (cytosine-5)-methyltransferase 1